MRKIELHDLNASLETGYVAIPVQGSKPTPTVTVSLIVRAQPDPVGGHFLLLRRSPRAEVFLGCLADYSGRPLEWIEIWVQNVSPGASVHPAYRSGLTNAVLDQQWRELADQLRELDPDNFISTPYETQPPRPAWIDRLTGSPAHAADTALCRDDARLGAAGLPVYSRSLDRYLFSPANGGRFIPVTPGAPENEQTVPVAKAIPESARGPAFNLAAAPMLFRRHAPLPLEDFAEVLGGKAWAGLENARKAFHPGGIYGLLEDADLLRCGTAHLFAAVGGRQGRLTETLHLKLQTIVEICRLTAESIRRTQLPQLTLTAESFGVSLGATGLGLPFLWTQKVSLLDPGSAFPLPISNSRERFFQAAEPLTASIYRPAEMAIPKSGHGSVRIRKVSPGSEGVVIEGTLGTQERIGVDESELIWVQLPLPGGQVDLYGFRDTTQAMAVGEAVFRTIPLQLPPETLSALQTVAGVPFSQVAFSILPPLNSPCDLYSLGVLAIRLLLVDVRQTLPQALDAMLSLARQLAASHDDATPFADRLNQVLGSDPRWLETLGPQHLRFEDATSAEAFAAIPARLWWDLIGLLSRFFPGTGPDSFCKGYGDAPALALHAIFEQPLEMLRALAIRSRALVTLEWQQNLEIATLIATAEQMG